MKLVSHFKDFLSETVNLNNDRFTKLENSIEAIKKYITASEWDAEIIKFAAQGSWAHKTIIKPTPGSPFDADLLVYIMPVDGWEAKDYINELHSIFSKSDTYRDKLRRFSHCVTIEYAGDRKIDVAPCIKERLYRDTYEVCNRVSNEFEESNPQEYTEWLHEKNRETTKDNLVKVTRLLKYMRDIKTNFTCPSFLLTTLLGMQIRSGDMLSGEFSDVPTALKILIGRLDDWLQQNISQPVVRNPVLATEIQSNAWDDTKYENFRAKINKYRLWIDEAYDEEDRNLSISAWRLIFGAGFASSEVVEKAKLVSRASNESFSLMDAMLDLVGRVKLMGSSALPPDFNNLPHMDKPRWRMNKIQIAVKVRAYLHSSRYTVRLGEVQSLQPLSPGHWIEFVALTGNGLPFPLDYQVEWRVTNTDVVATEKNALRGEFYNSDTHGVRVEQLSYRGVHLVEAFLIRKTDETLVGKSEVFHVAIE